jgi:hypothetical protein
MAGKKRQGGRANRCKVVEQKVFFLNARRSSKSQTKKARWSSKKCKAVEKKLNKKCKIPSKEMKDGRAEVTKKCKMREKERERKGGKRRGGKREGKVAGGGGGGKESNTGLPTSCPSKPLTSGRARQSLMSTRLRNFGVLHTVPCTFSMASPSASNP